MMDFLSTSDGILSVIIIVVALVVAYLYVWPSAPPRPPTQTWKPVAVPVTTQSKDTPKKANAAAVEADGPPAPNSIKILFGSQTGTAEEFAKTLAAEAKSKGFAPKVMDLEEFKPPEALKKERGGLIVLVVATYGDGEPTDNAKPFHDWIIDDDKTGANDGELPFQGVRFTVFGLGNKTYAHYNAIGKLFFKKAKELGGEVAYEMGMGDDDGTLEEDFNKWKSGLWNALSKTSGLEVAIPETTHQRRLKAYYSDPVHPGLELRSSSGTVLNSSQKKLGYDAKSPLDCKVVVNKELHGPTSDRSCRHVEIDLADLKYEPGDHLGIYPQNDTAIALQLAPRLGLKLDGEGGDLNRIIKLVVADQEDKTELGPCSIRQALVNLSDITSVPRKSLLKTLAFYATNPEERKKLEILSLSDGEQPADFNYKKFILDDYRSIAELLVNDFPSIQISLDAFLEIVPRLLPRFYSISSSPLEHGKSVHVTAVVTEFTKPTGRKHKGVCTTWLRDRSPGDSIPVFVRRSNFKLPQEVSTPILMIGPGTGLAPFRGFIHERRHQAKKAREQNQTAGVNLLFFGCRHPEVDYLYREELERHHSSSDINLSVAFSRLEPPNRKVYVQHLLKEKKKDIVKLLDQGGLHVYVCGEAKAMAKDVNKTLAEIIAEEKGITEQQAEELLNNLSKSGRYQQDVW